jgi:hypothetical protein
MHSEFQNGKAYNLMNSFAGLHFSPAHDGYGEHHTSVTEMKCTKGKNQTTAKEKIGINTHVRQRWRQWLCSRIAAIPEDAASDGSGRAA